jgi:hypothetical protein
VNDDPVPTTPRLNLTDAWLLAALLWRPHPERPAELWEVLENADWLNRAVPTYDMVSFGLQRLTAAGYVLSDATGTSATPKALQLLDRLKSQPIPDSLNGPVIAMERWLGVAPWPLPEEDDRYLGRLPDLTADDFAAAEAKCRRWSDPLGTTDDGARRHGRSGVELDRGGRNRRGQDHPSGACRHPDSSSIPRHVGVLD